MELTVFCSCYTIFVLKKEVNHIFLGGFNRLDLRVFSLNRFINEVGYNSIRLFREKQLMKSTEFARLSVRT